MKLQKSIKQIILACGAFALIGCLGIGEDDVKDAKDALSSEEQQQVADATKDLSEEEKKKVEAQPDECKILYAKVDKAEADAAADSSVTEEEEKAIQVVRGEYAEKCFDHLENIDFPKGEAKHDDQKDDGPKMSDRCEALFEVDKKLFIEKCFDQLVADNKPAGVTAGTCEEAYKDVWNQLKEVVLQNCTEAETDADEKRCEPLEAPVDAKIEVFKKACPNVDAENVFPKDKKGEHDGEGHDGEEHQNPEPRLDEKCQEKLQSSIKEASEDAVTGFIKECGEQYMPLIPQDLKEKEISETCKEGLRKVQYSTIKNVIQKCEGQEACFVDHHELLKDCPETKDNHEATQEPAPEPAK